MRLLSPAALSAGLGLALLTAPLAMAQAYANHPNAAPHAMASHQIQASSHRTASAMHEQMGTKARLQPREVSKRHRTTRDTHHAAMAPHHAMTAPRGNAPHQG
jgi:hypothetical protein